MEERFWKDVVEYKLVPVKKEKKTKALFTLTMPKNNSWNGHWSGEGRCFCKERTAFRYGKAVYPLLKEGNYGYDFGDGWFANVKVAFVIPSEARSAMRRSDGFCGYEWMIDEICKLGEIRPLEERRKKANELIKKIEL